MTSSNSDHLQSIESSMSAFEGKIETKIDDLSKSINAGYKELSESLRTHADVMKDRVYAVDLKHELLAQSVKVNQETLSGLGHRVTKSCEGLNAFVTKKSAWTLCVIVPSVVVTIIEVLKLVSK